MKNIGLIVGFALAVGAAQAQQTAKTQPTAQAQPAYHERWRPQFHFSPKAHWMNDPNGMVFDHGVYHLFFQYYPDSSVWGPMHWGHAVSKDMVHWEELPVALYPDKLGYIFSGSAVVDRNNTSGFGRTGQPPLVAIFTQHDPVGAGRNRKDFQNQSLAYSLDNGQHWTKYGGNPVLRNPGIPDFRDPKVFWSAEKREWIMALAVGDHIEFYSSENLKSWNKTGEFGKEAGAHGGVWECPDLFPLDDGHGHATWVLIVNINPGGPNGGSATQYFLGRFDGKTFVPSTAGARWLDYGPDEYAGVTWSNTGTRRIFFGWMSNWLYGQKVPTDPWRSANTVPRELGLEKVGDSLYVTSTPVHELDSLEGPPEEEIIPGQQAALVPAPLHIPAKVTVKTKRLTAFDLVFSNGSGDSTVIRFDGSGMYTIDRRHAGVAVDGDFDRVYTAPRVSRESTIDWTIYADESSFELFADGGLTVMTALVFPRHPYTKVVLQAREPGAVESFRHIPLDGIHNHL